jgi:NTE family protein
MNTLTFPRQVTLRWRARRRKRHVARRGRAPALGGARLVSRSACAVSLLSAMVLFGPGCAHAPSTGRATPPTCLVLSAGSARGLAHLGALRAFQERGVHPTCVVGSSMGALVGGLYASAPNEDPIGRFDAFVNRYVEATRAESEKNGLTAGLLLGGLAAALTGGVAIPVAAAVGGYMLGADATAKVDHARVVASLRAVTADAAIEALPVAYVALSAKREGDGIMLIDERSGPVAEAIGRSIANPYIFPDLDVSRAPGLDPGMDRLAAVPVSDACRLFPGARLWVVNVTGTPAVFDHGITCDVREIRVDPGPISLPEAFAQGPARAAVIEAGHRAATQALASAPTS